MARHAHPAALSHILRRVAFVPRTLLRAFLQCFAAPIVLIKAFLPNKDLTVTLQNNKSTFKMRAQFCSAQLYLSNIHRFAYTKGARFASLSNRSLSFTRTLNNEMRGQYSLPPVYYHLAIQQNY